MQYPPRKAEALLQVGGQRLVVLARPRVADLVVAAHDRPHTGDHGPLKRRVVDLKLRALIDMSALCFRTVDAENISRRAAEILLSDRLHLF